MLSVFMMPHKQLTKMPYKSDKQRRFMHARLPVIAKRWDKEQTNMAQRGKKMRRKIKSNSAVSNSATFEGAVERRLDKNINGSNSIGSGRKLMPSGRSISMPQSSAPRSVPNVPGVKSTKMSQGNSPMQATVRRRMQRRGDM